MLSTEDKQEIRVLLDEALTEEFRRRQELRLRAAEAHEAEKVTKLYLITVNGHLLGLPDDDGRAILSQNVYAKVVVNKNDPHFSGGVVELVAHSDGRRLKKPKIAILNFGSVSCMIEADEATLRPPL